MNFEAYQYASTADVHFDLSSISNVSLSLISYCSLSHYDRFLCLTAVHQNSTVITVALQHKQMRQPLKLAPVNVPAGDPDLHRTNSRFAICCD